MSKYFWLFIAILIFIAGYKIFPIYYNYFSIRGICQEHVDTYHKYGKQYVSKRVSESLNKLGIPEKQRQYRFIVTDEAVYLEIYYEDVAVFYDNYRKKFVFNHRCEGPLKTVY